MIVEKKKFYKFDISSEIMEKESEMWKWVDKVADGALDYKERGDEKSQMVEETEDASEIKNLKKIEAALFIAGKWLTMQDLIMLTDINPILIRELMSKLEEKYSDNSAIEILNKEDMWKMDVKEEHASMVNKLATGSSEFGKAEQETLAIIAYKQPIKQSVIIKIRGNKAYDHIRKFRDLGLVKAKRLGHTLELNLSEDFYNYFHLENKEK